MNLRQRFLSLAFGLGLIAGQAQAQIVDNFAIGFSPRTGDAWVDTQLGDINVFARGDSNRFIDDVVVSFGAPRYLVSEYLVDRRWAPGDIYYGCAIAYQLRIPCADVLRDYGQNHGQGWGVIAQRLGIKPGSAAFHALKGNVGKGHGKFKGRAGRPDMHPSGAADRGKPVQAGAADHGPGKGNSAGDKGKDKGNKGKGGGR